MAPACRRSTEGRTGAKGSSARRGRDGGETPMPELGCLPYVARHQLRQAWRQEEQDERGCARLFGRDCACRAGLDDGPPWASRRVLVHDRRTGPVAVRASGSLVWLASRGQKGKAPMSKRRFYITTAIHYVNGDPHIGLRSSACKRMYSRVTDGSAAKTFASSAVPTTTR